MELFHLFYFLTLFFNWLDRALFQAPPESFFEIQEVLIDPVATLDRDTVSLRPLRRPFIICFVIGLIFPLAVLAALAIVFGPVEILARPILGPGPALDMVQALVGGTCFLVIQVFCVHSMLQWFWFPSLEMAREGITCRMGDKSMFIPWFLLDSLPREPFIEKSNELEAIGVRPPNGLPKGSSIGQWIQYRDKEKVRNPWDVSLFPIQIGPRESLLFTNWFAIPHMKLVKMLVAIAAIQVIAGRGIPGNAGLT